MAVLHCLLQCSFGCWCYTSHVRVSTPFMGSGLERPLIQGQQQFESPSTVAVANPTAILGKTPEILELHAHVETSAVLSTQSSMSMSLRSAGYRCHWSAPVASHFSAPGQLPRRGCAGGTAILSALPSHGLWGIGNSVLLSLWFFCKSCRQSAKESGSFQCSTCQSWNL